jgi:hypothetical protein
MFICSSFEFENPFHDPVIIPVSNHDAVIPLPTATAKGPGFHEVSNTLPFG